MYLIIMSVIYPALSGTIMLIAVCPLMSTMTCGPTKRYSRAMILMIVQVVAYSVLIILRLRMRKVLKDPCTEDEYNKQTRRVEFLGLDVN